MIVKNSNLIEQAYIKQNLKLKEYVDHLNKLRKEKEEILVLAVAENPPKDILKRLDKNVKDFEKLLANSEKLKEQIKRFSNAINQD